MCILTLLCYCQNIFDVYINGEYRGNYLLMEKIEVSNNRLNIRNLEKELEELKGEKEEEA